ncbi:glycosyltransferase family 2 protein [Limosilactobacillus fermentum]|uniref:glycosyltransferase family 2 protein n=1 Tax=Limosilactobacillus fermentum TaxID=1613 RepID=UPI00124B5E4A|nr:glycosyltransferase family 2 protein [Limosilactobacillus fermentum]KAB1953852.1 glycosyltransferase family 2 protein [Limosilactobacillus fermentum]
MRLIVAIYHISNLGVAFARNTGLCFSRGQYIAFLDADDIWLPQYLEKEYKQIQKYPNNGFYCSRYIIQRDNREELSTENYSNGIIGTFWNVLKEKYDIVWTSATIVERKYIDETSLFPLKDEVGEDLGLWAEIAITHPHIVYCDEPLVAYIRNSQNNARQRTKILYPSTFFNLIDHEIKNNKNNDSELDSMLYKRDKKMMVHVLSLIVNRKKIAARNCLKNWNNKYFKAYKIILDFMLLCCQML